MTRAKQRLILTWGIVKALEHTPLFYLLHGQSSNIDKNNFLSQLTNIEKSLSNEDIKQQVVNLGLGKDSPIELIDLSLSLSLSDQGAIKSMPLTNTTGNSHILNCRSFLGFNHLFTWQLNSFSSWLNSDKKKSLSVNSIHEVDTKAIEDITLTESIPLNQYAKQNSSSFLAIANQSNRPTDNHLRMGREIGIFFHTVLELWNFNEENSTALNKIIHTEGDKINLSAEEKNQAQLILEKSISLPLSEAILNKSNINAFRLKDIAQHQRIVEMEFYYPTKKVAWKDFVNVWTEKIWQEQIQKLNRLPSSGFMKGFIDLIFFHQDKIYLLDWKSNFLGNQPQDYQIPSLEKIMLDEYYFLQAHIYTLALHLHWKKLLPSYSYAKNFGGVFYFFLRGAMFDAEKTSHNSSCPGIYFFKPHEQRIQQLEKLFIKTHH